MIITVTFIKQLVITINIFHLCIVDFVVVTERQLLQGKSSSSSFLSGIKMKIHLWRNKILNKFLYQMHVLKMTEIGCGSSS